MIDIFSIILRKIFKKTGAFCLHLIENKNRNKVFSISTRRAPWRGKLSDMCGELVLTVNAYRGNGTKS